jgi:membrane protein implicated in regulation of membrane protease activity
VALLYGTTLVLLAGQNIPFLVALGCCVALALIQIVAGFGDHDSQVDTDADADADLDLDADSGVDLDHDLDLDADADADADLDHDIEAGHHPEVAGAGTGILSALGIGRIPLMLVLMGFLGSFGAVGLIINSLLVAGGSYPSWGLVATLLASLVLAVPLTGTLSGALARVAPRSTTAVSFEQLVGRVGTVASGHVSSTYGRVAVRDSHGTLHTVYAVVEEGEPLPERSEVALLRYDQSQRRFIVAALGSVRRRRPA